MDLKTIVAARLAELKIGAVEAATKGGLERNFIKDLLDGRKTSPRAENLRKLALALDLPVDRLMGGDTTDLRVVSIEEAERVTVPPPIEGAVNSIGLGRGGRPGILPELEARAGAGNGDVGQVVSILSKGVETAHRVRGEWSIPVEFTRHALGADPRRTIILEVIGDSMRPTLEPGDKVLVDTSTEWCNDDSVWLIDDGTPKVKRLRLVRGSSPPRITIQSDNPLIAPEEVDLEDIRVIGRVVGRVSRM